jgi:uncharacterized protein (TIGR02453 family)
MATFAGFPKEGLQFFNNLASSNTKEWFAAHKQDYIDYIQIPAQEFVMALGPELRKISPTMEFAPSTSRGSIMRIYRDLRFSKDKTPYKTHLGVTFWDGKHAKLENPGYFFHMDSESAYLYGGLHMFSKPILEAYRQAVADDKLGPKIQSAIDSVASSGEYKVDGDKYKRVPRGFELDHPRADLLLYKGIWSRSPELNVAEITSPALVDICVRHAQAMAPLHHVMVEIAK